MPQSNKKMKWGEGVEKKKPHVQREFIAVGVVRAETDITTQSVIPPSIVGALLRAYVLVYVCSIHTLVDSGARMHMYTLAYTHTHTQTHV